MRAQNQPIAMQVRFYSDTDSTLVLVERILELVVSMLVVVEVEDSL